MTNDMSIDANSSDMAPAPKMPNELAAALGRPPLLRAESRMGYDALTAQVAATVDPQDVVEWLMIRDYVDFTWEILRLRRMKRHIVNLGAPDAVFHIADRLRHQRRDSDSGREAMQAWNVGGDARKSLCRQLARNDAGQETIDTEAFLARFGSIEKVETVLAQKEGLRRAVLRDLDLYRESSLWARRRLKVKDIEAVADRAALAPPAANGGQAGEG